MSQRPARPFRITRRPEITPSSPSTGQPAARTVPSSADGCPRCGALISDRDVHATFHEGLDRADRWMQAATQFLRLLAADRPELGIFPAQGDTASDGDNTTTDGEGGH